MKISIIGPTYPFRGGISHYTTLLCKTLRRQHDVQVISYTRQYPAFLFPGTTDKDPSIKTVSIEDVEYIIDSLNPWTWVKAAAKICEYKPDLLVVPWWIVFWAPHYFLIIKLIKRKIRAKIIFLCHNVVEHESNFLKVLGSKLVLAQADLLITHSEAETGKAQKLLGPGAAVETAFHPTYADLGFTVQDKDKSRDALGLKSRYVLLFFGFVRPYKGLDVLLAAMPRILEEVGDTTLLVVGEFWKTKETYLQQIESLNLKEHVILVDRYVPNEEVGVYFAAADLVVQPYRSATGSGICQLAYGFDRPVVATNCGSLAEIIADRDNGRLVEPGNVAGLAAAVADSLAPDTLQRLYEGAAATKTRYSWDRLAAIITRDSEK